MSLTNEEKIRPVLRMQPQQRGKWALTDFPHKGWECIGVEDYGSQAHTCGMCEQQDCRWVHHMRHDAWPETIEAGCDCADHMEGIPRAAATRVAHAKAARALRRREAKKALMQGRKVIAARYSGTCTHCKRHYAAGDKIAWSKSGLGSLCLDCISSLIDQTADQKDTDQ